MPTEAEIQAAKEAQEKAEREKVTFTTAQQAKIDEIIDKRISAVGSKARAEVQALETEREQLKTQLSQAQEQLKTLQKSGGGGSDEAATLKAEIQEMKRASAGTQDEIKRLQAQAAAEREATLKAQTETVNVKKAVAITSSASKANFVNVDVVVKLTAENIKYDSDKGAFIVLNDQGQPRMNAAYEPMSLDEFYQEYATKNPYLVRGDVKGGVGSNGSSRFDVSSNGKVEVKQVFGKESNAALALQLKKTNPAEYARMKKIAVEGGLIAG